MEREERVVRGLLARADSWLAEVEDPMRYRCFFFHLRQLKQAARAHEDPVQVVGDGEDLCKLARQLRREAEEVAGCWGENVRWEERVHPGIWDCNHHLDDLILRSHFDKKFFIQLKGRIIEIEQAAARKTDCC